MRDEPKSPARDHEQNTYPYVPYRCTNSITRQ
jgi:hypothetical protein